MDKAISICRAAEEVKVQTKEMQSNKTDMRSNVDHIKYKSKKGLKPAERKPARIIKIANIVEEVIYRLNVQPMAKSAMFVLRITISLRYVNREKL